MVAGPSAEILPLCPAGLDYDTTLASARPYRSFGVYIAKTRVFFLANVCMPDKAMVDNNTDAISEEQAVVSQSSDATGQDALKQNFSAAVAYAQERMEKMSVGMNASADVGFCDRCCCGRGGGVRDRLLTRSRRIAWFASATANRGRGKTCRSLSTRQQGHPADQEPDGSFTKSK